MLRAVRLLAIVVCLAEAGFAVAARHVAEEHAAARPKVQGPATTPDLLTALPIDRALLERGRPVTLDYANATQRRTAKFLQQRGGWGMMRHPDLYDDGDGASLIPLKATIH